VKKTYLLTNLHYITLHYITLQGRQNIPSGHRHTNV